LTTNKIEKFMIFPRSNESLPHAFMCYQLYYFIRKFTDKVKMYETLKPDIVFEANNKKYAIEVETGIALVHRKKLLDKKIENLKKFLEIIGFLLLVIEK